MLPAELGSLVTYNPTTVFAHTLLDDMVRMLDHEGFHHWPVVNDDREVIGVVSYVDVVRALEERRAAADALAVCVPGILPRRMRVEQFMSRQVVTVERDETAECALDLMLEHQIHSLPVVSGSQLVGIVTSTDFLRELTYGGGGVCQEPVWGLLTPVDEPLPVDATLDEAAAAFFERGTEYLGVAHGGCPLGAVSRRDVLKARCRRSAREMLGREFAAAGPTTVRELLANVRLLRPGASLGEAAQIMIDRQLQLVAVVNQANRLLGIVSEGGLLSAMQPVAS